MAGQVAPCAGLVSFVCLPLPASFGRTTLRRRPLRFCGCLGGRTTAKGGAAFGRSTRQGEMKGVNRAEAPACRQRFMGRGETSLTRRVSCCEVGVQLAAASRDGAIWNRWPFCCATLLVSQLLDTNCCIQTGKLIRRQVLGTNGGCKNCTLAAPAPTLPLVDTLACKVHVGSLC